MKLADVKRLPVGTKLRIVHCLLGPCNKLRIVHKVTSYEIQFTGDGIKEGEVSHLRLPKASEFRDDGDGFTILERTDDGVEIGAQYKFITE